MTFANPCTGARKARYRSGADSPRGVNHGQSDGARVPPRWSCHWGPLVAPAESARSRKLTPLRAVARRSCYVPLRFTSHDLRRSLQEPPEKGTGDHAKRGGGGRVPAKMTAFCVAVSRIFTAPEQSFSRVPQVAVAAAAGPLHRPDGRSPPPLRYASRRFAGEDATALLHHRSIRIYDTVRLGVFSRRSVATALVKARDPLARETGGGTTACKRTASQLSCEA